jgi:DisA bacterial checkpoint controller nucleotide-binding
MESIVYFSSVKNKLKKLIKDEVVNLPKGFLNNLLTFLSTACNYEEEETKIRPRILLGSDIKSFRKLVPNNYILKIADGNRSGSNLGKILKSIMPFCNNGWIAYIDTNSTNPNVVEYGILRSFSGPKGLSFTEIVFDNPNGGYGFGAGLIDIEVLSNYEIMFNGLLGNRLMIDFRLISKEKNEAYKELFEMASDITIDVPDEIKRKDAKKVVVKLLKTASQKIHGTICLVVKDDTTFPNDILSDGIWFEKPIGIVDAAQESIDINKDIYLNEKFYGLSGLFIEMLNMDGITVINTKGQVLGYNAFLKTSNTEKKKIAGGARKRAAQTLMDMDDQRVIGVYFQSQDGNSLYKGGSIS